MLNLGCLRNRSRLERHVDGGLDSRVALRLESHLSGCAGCAARVRELERLRALVRSALAEPGEPDWATFWPAVRARIVNDKPRPVRDAWWLPFWKPVWGHPRLALGGVALAVMAVLSLTFWPVPDQNAWGAVTVQAVSAPDPEGSVMVYSSPDPDHSLTVIWLFTPESPTEES